MVSLKVTPSLESLAARFRSFVDAGWRAGLHAMADEATAVQMEYLRNETPVGTHPSGPSDHREAGTLRDSAASQVMELSASHLRVDISMEDPIVGFVIHGTAPHVIEPVHADFLAWYGADGKVVFRRHVDHPGTSANDFVQRAVDAAAPDISAILVDTAQQAIRDLTGGA